MEYISKSDRQTQAVGFRLGSALSANRVVCFFGDLGAGKTTLIKGIAQAFGVAEHAVNSPTFVYLNIYEGELSLYHFDLYRLKEGAEFNDMGFDEMFDRGGICCIEWSERIAAFLPKDCIQVKIAHREGGTRHITIEGTL